MARRMVKIDGDKLYEQFQERNLAHARICRDAGVNESYFANAKSRGCMTQLMVEFLESRFGISRTSYIKPEEEKVEEVIETDIVVSEANDFFSEENQKKLYQIMYSAMYNAVKQALNE